MGSFGFKTPTKCVRNTWVGVSSWRLCTGYPAIRLSSRSVFQAFIFVLWRYLKGQLLVSLYWHDFCAISEMQKVFLVLQVFIFSISCSMESNSVADWWWTVWFDILFTFSQLLNLHPCCRIRATKCVQRTIALYQYKLFNLFPFSVIEFCEVVMLNLGHNRAVHTRYNKPRLILLWPRLT